MKHVIGQGHKELKRLFKHNESLISKFLESEIRLFHSLFDIQQKLLKNHISWIFDPYYGLTSSRKIVFQSCLKNSDLLFTSNNLIVQGHFGAAMIITRQIFEFLLMGKYCFLVHKEGFVNRWLDGKQVDIYNEVVKKSLMKPDKKNFTEFWAMICNFTHATTSSNQGSFNFESNQDQILSTYHILLLLLCCNYHLLNRCALDRRLAYRSEEFGGHKAENSRLKKAAKLVIAEIRLKSSKKGTDFIKDYCGRWEYKV